jgi:hypothetical protein
MQLDSRLEKYIPLQLEPVAIRLILLQNYFGPGSEERLSKSTPE